MIHRFSTLKSGFSKKRLALLGSSFLLLVLFFASRTYFSLKTNCLENSEAQHAATLKLKLMSDAAFIDRKNYTVDLNASLIKEDDSLRLKQTKEFIKNKCIQSAEDYEYAANLLLKSGLEEDLLTVISYEQKAISMGLTDQIWVISNVVDQLLVQRGEKQLFGTQLGKAANSDYCMYEVEPGFSDEIRVQYTNGNLKQIFHDLVSVMNPPQDPDQLLICDRVLLPAKRGSFPGIW